MLFYTLKKSLVLSQMRNHHCCKTFSPKTAAKSKLLALMYLHINFYQLIIFVVQNIFMCSHLHLGNSWTLWTLSDFQKTGTLSKSANFSPFFKPFVAKIFSNFPLRGGGVPPISTKLYLTK